MLKKLISLAFFIVVLIFNQALSDSNFTILPKIKPNINTIKKSPKSGKILPLKKPEKKNKSQFFKKDSSSPSKETE